MNKIFFATTNSDKLAEAREILDIEVEGASLKIEEIQSLDPEKVALHKARSYFDQLKKPMFVEDVSLTFNALNGLPGTFVNDFWKALGNDGLINLLVNKEDRSAYALTTLVYIERDNSEHIFTGRIDGKISKKPKGDKGWGWDPIFIPKGEEVTFGEMDSKIKNKYSMRAKALHQMKSYLSKSEKI